MGTIFCMYVCVCAGFAMTGRLHEIIIVQMRMDCVVDSPLLLDSP